MAADKAFYITTAIAYPNGVPHIGHAYEYIATDVIARFQRLDGHEVYLVDTDDVIPDADPGDGRRLPLLADQ